MTKQEAVSLLGARTNQEAAEILGITKGAFSMWPDTLTKRLMDRVLGAAVRTERLHCEYPNLEQIESGTA